MSQLVYVIDAEGQARMPVSGSTARELVRTGDAVWREGYVFPLIERATTLPESTLRPIVVGVAIEPDMASLWIAAAGEYADDIIPLMSVALDLTMSRTVRRRSSVNQLIDTHALNIRAVIGLVSFFLPLSHFVIFDPPGSPAGAVARRFEKYMKGDDAHVQRVTSAEQPVVAVPPMLAAWLHHCFIQKPAPNHICVPVTLLTARQRLMIQREPVELFVPGIVTIGDGDNTFTGVIHRVPRTRHDIEVHVPVAIEQERIIWQRVMVEQQLIRQNVLAVVIALTPMNPVTPQEGIRLLNTPLH